MRHYFSSRGKGLLPFAVGTMMISYTLRGEAEEYAPVFVKQVNEQKGQGEDEPISEGKTLEQCVANRNEREYKPQEICRFRLREYRVPASGLRGLVGRTQMKLKDSEFVDLRKPERSYGRQELVDVINYSACVMQQVYGAELVVHDLSREGGGRLRPHRSHRNGRDADVGIYGFDEAREEYYNTTHSMKKRGRLHPDFNNDQALDANWLFIDSLMRGPYEIDMIFLDRKLINGLRSYVVGKYGEQRWSEAGRVLRHEPGHATHYHIRTKVPSGEPKT